MTAIRRTIPRVTLETEGDRFEPMEGSPAGRVVPLQGSGAHVNGLVVDQYAVAGRLHVRLYDPSSGDVCWFAAASGLRLRGTGE